MHYFLNPLENKRSTHKTTSHSKEKKNVILTPEEDSSIQEINIFEWTFPQIFCPNIRVLNEGKSIFLNPFYSSGTAFLKGKKSFQQNFHYYWEIKILSTLYGTDFMIGVGTSKIEFEKWRFKFASLLGIDAESWGFSYHGKLQHNKLTRRYGKPFKEGSVVGVHLDMCRGTLEYFLNRKSLGIAFRGLKDKVLYPMVCSTAAKTSIELICSISKAPSMQLLCLKQIMNSPSLYRKYKTTPGLSKIFDKQFFWMQPHIFIDFDERKRMAELEEDVLLSLVDDKYLLSNKKVCSSANGKMPPQNDNTSKNIPSLTYLNLSLSLQNDKEDSSDSDSESDADADELSIIL